MSNSVEAMVCADATTAYAANSVSNILLITALFVFFAVDTFVAVVAVWEAGRAPTRALAKSSTSGRTADTPRLPKEDNGSASVSAAWGGALLQSELRMPSFGSRP